MKSVDFEEKLDVVQSIEKELWGFYEVADLRELRALIRERKRLANSKRYAEKNAKTGKSAAALKGQLNHNAEHFGVVEDWAEVEI